jgi:hypothetical protein
VVKTQSSAVFSPWLRSRGDGLVWFYEPNYRKLLCWGNLGDPPQLPPGTGPYAQVVAGQGFARGLFGDGTATCWGNNDSAQCAPRSGPFTSFDHTCGLRSDGTLYCWGEYQGPGYTPTDPAFIQVSDGGSYSCGVRNDGTIAC